MLRLSAATLPSLYVAVRVPSADRTFPTQIDIVSGTDGSVAKVCNVVDRQLVAEPIAPVFEQGTEVGDCLITTVHDGATRRRTLEQTPRRQSAMRSTRTLRPWMPSVPTPRCVWCVSVDAHVSPRLESSAIQKAIQDEEEVMIGLTCRTQTQTNAACPMFTAPPTMRLPACDGHCAAHPPALQPALRAERGCGSAFQAAAVWHRRSWQRAPGCPGRIEMRTYITQGAKPQR